MSFDQSDKSIRKQVKMVFNYFLRGLLFLFPVVATVWIIIAAIDWVSGGVDSLFNNLFGINAPLLSILIVFIAIVLVGYFISNAIAKPFLKVFESIIMKIPLIGMIYSSIKDLVEAFVGEKRKFTEPVLIKLNDSNLYKLGFITQSDLSKLGLSGLVAVYCPHSYNFSGNLFLTEAENITPVKANSAEVMKFIVSAGVTNINEGKKHKHEEIEKPR